MNRINNAVYEDTVRLLLKGVKTIYDRVKVIYEFNAITVGYLLSCKYCANNLLKEMAFILTSNIYTEYE
jgi:hypothetical protein